jgi:cell division protein FtsN
MAKEYPKRRPPPQKKRSFQRGLVLFVTFLCGYAVATVWDPATLTTFAQKHFPSTKNHTKLKKVAKPAAPKPTFEFYTLLTKDSPPLPRPLLEKKNKELQERKAFAQTSPSLPLPPTAPTKTGTQETFSLQIAAFTKRQEAENLQASLLLKGYDAAVTPILKNRVPWFRVVIGPFPSRKDAEKAQIALVQSERYRGILFRG